MNEEEKIAFNYYKGCNENDLKRFDDFSEVSKKTIKYTETLLHLIEKQQKEIKKLEDRNKTLEIEFEIKKYCKVNELASDLIFYKNLARDYQGNCISKDKIKELREIDNIDLIQFKIKELLGENEK